MKETDPIWSPICSSLLQTESRDVRLVIRLGNLNSEGRVQDGDSGSLFNAWCCHWFCLFLKASIFLNFYLFIFGCAGSSLLLRDFSLVAMCGLLIAMASLVAEHGLWSVGSVVAAHGLVAPWLVEPSRSRDQTDVPCIGRWILNHWITSKVQGFILNASTGVGA